MNPEIITPEVAAELLSKLRHIAATSETASQAWARIVGSVMGCASPTVSYAETAAFVPKGGA